MKISKNKALDISFFEKSYTTRFDIFWNYRGKGFDHPGFGFYLTLFNCTIIEFDFYDVRHAEDIK